MVTLAVLIMHFSCSGKDDMMETLDSLMKVDTINIVPSFHVADTLLVYDTIQVEVEKFFSFKTESQTSNQGMAIYNNMMFQCYHSNNIIDIIDLENKETVASIYLEPEELIHCNNVYFGKDFYDLNDSYPLLYIQKRGTANKLNVYRICSKSDTILSAELVQTMSFFYCKSSISVISRVDKTLYIVYSNGENRYIGLFDIRLLSNKGINLDVRNAVRTYYLPCTKTIQDTACDDKYLYFLCGLHNEGELWKIDMKTGKAVIIDLPTNKLKREPEGIDCYKDWIIVSFIDHSVYKLSIN
jgi:hypothetical protein